MLKIFVGLLVLWETVYTVSFGIAQFKNGKKAGAVFAIFLAFFTAILYFNYVFDKIYL